MENSNKMEQQCPKQITNRKEQNWVRKEKEAECKGHEEEQLRESKNTAVVLLAPSQEEATMHIDQPNPGITTLLSDMIQGNTKTEEGENIDPETRSPLKNKQKNNAPAPKPSKMAMAVPEKSVHTKNNKHVYKFSRIVVEASIKLSNDNPFQEFIVAFQNLLQIGQLVNPLFAFSPIKMGGLEKKDPWVVCYSYQYDFAGRPF